MITRFDLFYCLACLVGWPFVLARLLRKAHYRASLRQKRGFVPRRTSGRKCLWVHGVSGGEIPAAAPLIEAFEQAHPDWDIVVSTTTEVGWQKTEELFADRLRFYWPLDFSWMVRRTLDRIRPDLVVTIEAELWPNFIGEAHRRGIPVCIVNGRFSRSTVHLHHRAFRWGIGRTYARLGAIGVQSAIYADRLIGLGVDPLKVTVTGSLKYDSVATRSFDDRDEELIETFGLAGKPVIVAGSTHNEEEGWLLDAFATLRKTRPELRLILAPRKPDRYDDVARLVASRGYSLLRRTWTTGAAKPPAELPEHPDVILLDTFGELTKVYSLADIVFVGRSLVPFGGSNIMEPAALEKPIVFGPHMENFPDAAAEMVDRNAAVQLAGPGELAETLDRLLAQPDRARHMGQRARQILEQNRGAARRSVELLEKCLTDGR